ncbi:MAG: hypothetical protein PHE20_03270 [Patescibacteria group bacterium]|nr:hypothetical protein [Patescibacteria group bacterium]
MRKKRPSKKTKWIIGLTLFFVFIIVISLTSQNSPIPETTHKDISNMTALQQMTIAFDGDYPEKEIKDRITEAMVLYNVPITEENYSKAGSSLVALKNNSNIEEMLILDYMINKLYTPSANLSFPEAAGLSVTVLKTGAN